MGMLEAALDRLCEALGAECQVSSVIQTPACGFDGADFLNCAARFETDVEPLELLHICKRIERELGREGGPEYAADGSRVYHDRPIDIDILMYGDLRMDTPELTIPHPRMLERDFVMIPLKELCSSGE